MHHALKPLRVQERRWWGRLLLLAYIVLILMLPLLAHVTRTVSPGLTLGFARSLGLVGFFHGLNAAGEAMPPPMRLYFILLTVTSIILFIHGNVVKKLWGRSRWRVASVTQETHDTYTLTLEPDGEDRFAYRPGQFVFLSLKRPGRSSEEHPFTLSSSPAKDSSIAVTIKASGDFTRSIAQTVPGDRALIDGPFGRFSFAYDVPDNMVFIAGGVGITPILSMMRHLRDSGDRRHVVLIDANKTDQDIIRREELAAMPENMTVHHVLESPPEGWSGHTGRISGDVMTACAGEGLLHADVYLCGPPAMMTAVRAQLRAFGVSRARIHCERFAL